MRIRPSVLLIVAAVTGCGGIIDSVFGGGDDDKDTSGGPQAGTFTVGTQVDASDIDATACTGLCFQQVTCDNGGTTSVSGTVMDPAGKNPLYNILVFVPNAPVAPIVQGATCDRCGSVSGNPLVSAITGTSGTFKLENVPVGKNIPLVIQVGKWRRQLVIPEVKRCVDTPLPNESIRLPKNHTEGDIPHIALTTGGADVMECLLRKVGIDDSEFSTGTGAGRINFYEGSTAQKITSKFDATHNAGAKFSSAQDFWSDSAALMKYDMVILSCEGETFPATKPPVALKALYDFANAGGRVFASHWHRFWFSTAAENDATNQPAGPQPSPFEDIGVWNDRQAPGDNNQVATGIIDTSFPKGAAMEEWLVTVKASTTPGQIPINESKANIDSVNLAHATQWITMNNTAAGGKQAVEYLSFNAPILAADDAKCGRVVYSDLHVSSGDDIGKDWPQGCIKPDLLPQEKALEFMLFDLSSCVQSDKLPPTPPPTVH